MKKQILPSKCCLSKLSIDYKHEIHSNQTSFYFFLAFLPPTKLRYTSLPVDTSQGRQMNLPWKSSKGDGGQLSNKFSNTKSTSSKHKMDKYFSIDDNRECIAMFFRFINDEVKKVHLKGIILFCIENDINWLVTLSEGSQYIVPKLLEQCSPDCIVYMDSYAMTKLARGVLKPMSAILGGQLKLEGDTNIFGEFSSILRSSVKAMMEHNKTNFNLDVSILKTYSQADDEKTKNHGGGGGGGGGSGSRHTEYVIRSIDRIGGNYWETPHRFSDFVNFRKILKDSGYLNLPDLPRKHIIQSSISPNVVRRRMEDLALFLQLVIIQIGSSEPHVVNFLGAYLSSNIQTTILQEHHDDHDMVSPGGIGDTDDRGEGGGNGEDIDRFPSSIDETLKMKHALKVAQEHVEYYVHEIQRKPSISSVPFYSGSFSVDHNHTSAMINDTTKSTISARDGLTSQLSSTLNYSSLSISSSSNSGRTNIVRNEIFQLKKRIESLESGSGDGKSYSSSMASLFLHLLPRVTLWGTILSLILGITIPLLLSSSQRIIMNYSHFFESGVTLFLLLRTFSAVVTYLFSCIMILFIVSMPYSRLAAAVGLGIYLLYPLLSPFLLMLLEIFHLLIHGDSVSLFSSSTPLCGIGVYLADQALCSYSPTRILITSLSFISYQILIRKGSLILLAIWLTSIPINYSIHTMKNFGVKVFPPHPLTTLFKYIMIIERLFTIYTPIATVVSAYIYLTLFLKVFGYATPSLLTGTNNTTTTDSHTNKSFPTSDANHRQFNDSNKNLTASAYHALDRVLAEYVLNEICSLQSIFIKMGQYIASRPDLVSSLWSTTLSKLHDNCPTSSSLYVKTLVETCLTHTKNKDEKYSTRHKIYYQKKKLRSLDELFESFDMKPIASGCIGQYHQATMIIDQQLYDVIVKVQHPTIETLFDIDMSALKAIVTVATKFYSKWTVSLLTHTAFLPSLSHSLCLSPLSVSLYLSFSSLLSFLHSSP
jgi:hypothetical protein